MQSDGDRNMDMVKKRAWLKGRRRVQRESVAQWHKKRLKWQMIMHFYDVT